MGGRLLVLLGLFGAGARAGGGVTSGLLSTNKCNLHQKHNSSSVRALTTNRKIATDSNNNWWLWLLVWEVSGKNIWICWKNPSQLPFIGLVALFSCSLFLRQTCQFGARNYHNLVDSNPKQLTSVSLLVIIYTLAGFLTVFCCSCLLLLLFWSLLLIVACWRW